MNHFLTSSSNWKQSRTYQAIRHQSGIDYRNIDIHLLEMLCGFAKIDLTQKTRHSKNGILQLLDCQFDLVSSLLKSPQVQEKILRYVAQTKIAPRILEAESSHASSLQMDSRKGDSFSVNQPQISYFPPLGNPVPFPRSSATVPDNPGAFNSPSSSPEASFPASFPASESTKQQTPTSLNFDVGADTDQEVNCCFVDLDHELDPEDDFVDLEVQLYEDAMIFSCH